MDEKQLMPQTPAEPAAAPEPLHKASAKASEIQPSVEPTGKPIGELTGQVSVERLFEKAVAENSRRLLGIARGIVGNRASPEDVVQQAVMNLYQHRMRYDWREPGGLLRRAVVNESLRLLRQPKTTTVEEEYHGAASAPPETGLIERETVVQVRRAIDRLPENFKAALVLCEYEQMPYAQIAETLGASIPQVKTWIFRARRQLAEMLKDYAAS
jgi:RNA polymerase sigma factor (sigma-70 family)